MSSQASPRSVPFTRAILPSVLAAGALLALALALAVAAPTAAASKGCGTVKSASIYPRGKVKVLQGVSCRTARKVAKKYDHRGKSSKGYSCFLGHGGRTLFSCGKGGSSGNVRNFRHAFTVKGVGKPS